MRTPVSARKISASRASAPGRPSCSSTAAWSAPQRTWRHQLALAEHWSLCLPDRPGFGASPPLDRGDFEAEAPLIAELLGDGAHLVGHSYGAVIALHAAALRPHAVRSLTVSEPGCLRVAAGDELVDAQIAGGEYLYEHAASFAPLDFLRAFRGGVGSTHDTPGRLAGELLPAYAC